MRPEEDEKGKRRGKVRQEQMERSEIERPEEDADGMWKTKEDGDEDGREKRQDKDNSRGRKIAGGSEWE